MRIEKIAEFNSGIDIESRFILAAQTDFKGNIEIVQRNFVPFIIVRIGKRFNGGEGIAVRKKRGDELSVVVIVFK